jgi:capsular exopolysaccharide synthesis family protein
MSARRLDQRLVSLTAPDSLEAEQYQALRLKLESLQRTRDIKVIAIASPGARDGKTLTAVNLAAALTSGSNARVLLIEADLRRPAVSRYLGGDAGKAHGLAELILDPSRNLGDVVRQHELLRFDVILAGSAAAPVHEVFRSPRLETIIQEARQHYDFVIIDTPPLGHVADGALIARWIDGLLLIVAAHRTPRKQLEESLNLLDGTTVIGIVFNGDDRAFRGYRYRPDLYRRPVSQLA